MSKVSFGQAYEERILPHLLQDDSEELWLTGRDGSCTVHPELALAGTPTSNVIKAFETVPLFSNYQESREDYEEAVPGSLDTRWRGAGAHLHGEGATVGSGALEATRLHFPAQAGAPQGAHFGGGGGEGGQPGRRWRRSQWERHLRGLGAGLFHPIESFTCS